MTSSKFSPPTAPDDLSISRWIVSFGMFAALDLFFIFVWFDVSLFPMYLLIAVWGSTRKEYGAMKLTLYLLAGSVGLRVFAAGPFWGMCWR